MSAHNIEIKFIDKPLLLLNNENELNNSIEPLDKKRVQLHRFQHLFKKES
jgi:hypothetical protein